jgi:hypothetical protein
MINQVKKFFWFDDLSGSDGWSLARRGLGERRGWRHIGGCVNMSTRSTNFVKSGSADEYKSMALGGNCGRGGNAGRLSVDGFAVK